MSEFPEWVEREMGVWWSPSREEARKIHGYLTSGLWLDPRDRGTARIWWRSYWPFDRRREDYAQWPKPGS